MKLINPNTREEQMLSEITLDHISEKGLIALIEEINKLHYKHSTLRGEFLLDALTQIALELAGRVK